MKTRARLIVLYCLFFALLAACRSDAESLDIHFENSDGSKSPMLSAEIVRTHSARMKGMMFRREMDETFGMLFIFPEEKPRSFWMKNTYLELDIIYVAADGKVVSVTERAVPLSETKRPSKGAAKYVVEVRGGSAKKWGIVRGSVLKAAGPIPDAVG